MYRPLIGILCATMVAGAQTADDYRGGWRTDQGSPHIYQFSISGERVRGVYCTYCADATTLAFIDGKFSPQGIEFTVLHVKSDGSTNFQEKASAKFDGGTLMITGNSQRGGRYERRLIKDSRGPDPIPVIVSMLPKKVVPALPRPTGGGGGGARPAPYKQPGPWLSPVRAKDVIGIWLGFGVGMDKQYFIIRNVGGKLRGMVCGRCDNPYTMAALDDFELQGDLLKFNILHEDWGDGELPTFAKHVTCHAGWNELRCTTAADHQPAPPPPPPGVIPGFSLTGPIPIEATTSNH